MASQAETVRGKERIQQLMEGFPEIPRSLVVKADVLREGVKPNAASRQIGKWALPDAHWYFGYDKEDTHTPEETTEGYTLSPVAAYFPNGVAWHIMFDSRSPYEFRYEERGHYRLYRDGEPVEEVLFTARPTWYEKKTSSGRPMSSVIALRGEDNLFMAALTYCEYAKDDLLCRYCNINASEPVKKGLGMERLVAKREKDVYETYVAAARENFPPLQSVGMSGGVLLDSGKEADNYVRIVKALKRAMKEVGAEVPISVTCQAMGPEDQMKLKEAGATVRHNLEVWDPRLFEIICPGKAKYVGREKWIEALLNAARIFGSTSTSIVLGVEMAQPYGFKTEDEAGESFLEGCEWLMPRGVMPTGSIWRPVPGTQFASLPSPRTEYFLRMSLAHYKLTIKYNKAPKPGKPSTPAQGLFGDFPHVALPGAKADATSTVAGPSGDVC